MSLTLLLDPAAPDMDAVIALYERAIPASERRSSDAFRSLAHSPDHKIAAWKDGNAVAGFFLLFSGARVAMLEYMAVDEACRGSGLGTRLFREAVAAAGAIPLLVEVEAERAADAGSDLRRRRLAFYRRLGARRLVGVEYILPLKAEGTPPPLDLLVQGYPDPAVPLPTVRAWLQEVYTRVYGCPCDDPRLNLMLVDCPPLVSLD